MLDSELGVQLKTRGWDVESVQLEHRVLIGQDDDAVLAYSTGVERAVVTDNARDFVALHEQWLTEGRSHAGLVIAPSRQYPRAKKTLGIWIEGLDAFLKDPPSQTLNNQCVWLRPPGEAEI